MNYLVCLIPPSAGYRYFSSRMNFIVDLRITKKEEDFRTHFTWKIFDKSLKLKM